MNSIIIDNIKVNAFYDYKYNSFQMKPHGHNSIEIMYLTSGSASIDVLGEKFELKKNQLVIINSNINHKLFVPAKGHILNLEIQPTTAIHSIPITDFMPKKFTEAKFLKIQDDGIIFQCLNTTLQELSRKNTDDTMVTLKTLELLRYISEKYINENFENPLISKAISFIDTNFALNITVDDIAQHVNLNRSYLQRKFKIATNQTIVDYIANLRIDKAKKMMTATSLPIIDIAVSVGYNSRQSFFKSFKKITGLSPSEYYSINQNEIQGRYVQTPYNK